MAFMSFAARASGNFGVLCRNSYVVYSISLLEPMMFLKLIFKSTRETLKSDLSQKLAPFECF